MSGQDNSTIQSAPTERTNVDPHAASLLRKLRSDVAWPPQALETLTNVLKHYATSVDNNPDKWTELAKCLINNLPSVTSQAFNSLKELEKAYVDMEKTKVQLKQRKDEHKMLQSRLKEAIGNTAALQAEVVKAQQQVVELQAELKKREAQCADLEDQLKGMVVRGEETRAHCEALERENKVLRKELEELKSRSLQQPFTPPPVRAFAEGDNIAGPSGIQQVDQARSAFRPTRLFPEEPIGNAQGSPRLVDQEVPMNRQRSHIGAKGTQTGPQPAARPPGGVAGPSRAVQASPASITPDRPSVRTTPASPNPPPSIDEYGRLSKAELEAKIAELTQRGCVSVFRTAGILTTWPNRDPGDDLLEDQLFEIVAWLLPDTRLPSTITDLVKMLKKKDILKKGAHNVKGSVELVQAAYAEKPKELAPAIQLVPWEDTHLHSEELTQLLIRLGVKEVLEAYKQNKLFSERDLRRKANQLTGAAPAATCLR